MSSLAGVDGLVIWNLVASICYLLTLCLWGAEYNLTLKPNLGISETLRPAGLLQSHSSLGWSCL